MIQRFTIRCMIYFISSIQATTVDHVIKLIDDNIENAKKWTYPEKNTDFPEHVNGPVIDFGSYDFVIVGAGSGGATLARKLSDHRDWKILLIEAGGNETEFNIIPAASTDILPSNLNWGYLTTPQKNACQSSYNNQCPYPRGKLLGGTSAINSMMFSRGIPLDYENWVNLGNDGWSSRRVSCYYKQIENVHFRADYNYRGTNGNQDINHNKPNPQIIRKLIKGYNELGYPTVDFNGASSLGVGQMQAMIKNGKRQSANAAFLQRAISRKNIKILTKALATKIIFKRDKSVKELHFIYKNQSYFVRPKLELVVAGGTINTPQLLMLSGIGPRDHLESLNISVVADLPVGKNFEDHPTAFLFTIQTNATVNNYTLKEQVKQYLKGYGPMTWSTALAVNFIQTNKSLPKGYPNIEISFQFPNLNFPDQTLKAFNLKENFIPVFSALKANSLIGNVALLHPKSRGKISLKSTKPTDYPLIDINYFGDSDDIETLYQGIVLALQVIKTPSLRKLNATLEPNRIPECRGLVGKESIICQIRHITLGGHPTGTCRMGNNTKTSVVNTHLQVHGFKKLRIVDASVIPAITSGHTHGPVVMIAYKIADELKRLYLRRKPSC